MRGPDSTLAIPGLPKLDLPATECGGFPHLGGLAVSAARHMDGSRSRARDPHVSFNVAAHRQDSSP